MPLNAAISYPEPVPSAGVRIVFVAEPVAEGNGFPVLQVTAVDGSEQSSVILDCQQQLFALAEASSLHSVIDFHDADAELACARLPRSCPRHLVL